MAVITAAYNKKDRGTAMDVGLYEFRVASPMPVVRQATNLVIFNYVSIFHFQVQLFD